MRIARLAFVALAALPTAVGAAVVGVLVAVVGQGVLADLDARAGAEQLLPHQLAVDPHLRARGADHELVALGDCVVDECPRETSLEKMASLPVLEEGSRSTAAVASQICDGAAATLVVSEASAKVLIDRLSDD